MIERWRTWRRNEARNVASPFAVSLIVVLGLAAVVIDLGQARVVKRERLRQHLGAQAGPLTISPP